MSKLAKALIFLKRTPGLLLHLAAASLLLVACGDGSRNSNAERYVYKNPDKGQEVELKEASTVNRLAESAKPQPTVKKSIRLYDGFFKVDLTTRNVSFRFKKETPTGETVKVEEILLKGQLSKEMKGWIDDAEGKKLGGSRAYAYVSCFPDSKGNVCATSYVSVRYADENGDEQEKQFHASPRDAELKRKKAKKQADEKAKQGSQTQSGTASPSPTIIITPPATTGTTPTIKTPAVQAPQLAPAQSPPKIEVDNDTLPDQAIVTQIDEKEYSIIEEREEAPKPTLKKPKPAPAPVKPGAKTPPPPAVDDEEEETEGTTHEDDDDDSGMYVTPQTPETLKKRLIGKKPTKPTPTKPGTPPAPTVNNGKPQSTLGLSLNLSDGGHSKLTPNNGSIWNASLMPTSGAGFTRRSEDGKAYASGFLVGFIQESARRFALDNPNCGPLNINQISLKKGGYFKGHASHRNGSDIDLAYFNNPPGTKVVRYLKTTVVNNKNKKKKTVYRATTKNDFDHLCFLKYLKFMDDQKLTNTGDSRYDGDDIVDLVFVNAGVQAGVCAYMKQNKLTQKYGEAVNLMYPETGHDSHFHLRMRCSPKHLECRPKDLDRVAPFKKRGCR